MRRYLRLRHPLDFAKVRLRGQSFAHRFFYMNLLQNGLHQNRYGFVTSKRLGNAVTRNRARRLLRESVRQLHPSEGYDVVFVARANLVGQEYGVIHKAVKKAFHQANLLVHAIE